MCAFLPLSLIPTYVQTRLGVLSKSESEHRALQAGQKCARTLLRWIPLMNAKVTPQRNGNPNEYNRSSFKQMLNETRKAIDEGFDIFVLPEGQLNPTPEKGLQPILPGAYAISKGSKRPMQFVGLHGCHHLWHADEASA
ncbi:hypothetical protein ACHAXT_000172 [Thalassiosira profunda]